MDVMSNSRMPDEEPRDGGHENKMYPGNPLPRSNEEGESLAKALDLLTATHCAAIGELDEAEKILSRNGVSSTPNATLDMLARVLIGKGQFRQARQLWSAILEREPDNESAKAALARLRTPWLAIAVAKRLWLLAAIATVLALATTGLLAICRPQFFVDGSPSVVPPPSIREQPIPLSVMTESDSQSQDISMDTVISLEEGSILKREPEPAPLPAIFNISGAAVSAKMNELQIIFDEGLFSYRCEFTDAARQLLAAAGRAIAEHAPDCRIIVEGHTDSDPLPANSTYEDNFALGLQRAVVAVAVLKHTGIPGQDILAASAGDQFPPFVGDDYEAQQKNRTVVIRLLRKATGQAREGENY